MVISRVNCVNFAPNRIYNLEFAAATDLSASQSTMALLTLLKDTLASSSVMEEQVWATNTFFKFVFSRVVWTFVDFH